MPEQTRDNLIEELSIFVVGMTHKRAACVADYLIGADWIRGLSVKDAPSAQACPPMSGETSRPIADQNRIAELSLLESRAKARLSNASILLDRAVLQIGNAISDAVRETRMEIDTFFEDASLADDLLATAKALP